VDTLSGTELGAKRRVPAWNLRRNPRNGTTRARDWGTGRMITKRSSGLGWTQGNGLLCLGRQGLTPARLVSRLRTAARPSYRGVVLRSLWMEDGLRRDAGAGCRTRAHGHVTVPLMPIAITLSYEYSLCSFVAQHKYAISFRHNCMYWQADHPRELHFGCV
jgi:hypothetical protein